MYIKQASYLGELPKQSKVKYIPLGPHRLFHHESEAQLRKKPLCSAVCGFSEAVSDGLP